MKWIDFVAKLYEELVSNDHFYDFRFNFKSE